MYYTLSFIFVLGISAVGHAKVTSPSSSDSVSVNTGCMVSWDKEGLSGSLDAYLVPSGSSDISKIIATIGTRLDNSGSYKWSGDQSISLSSSSAEIIIIDSVQVISISDSFQIYEGSSRSSSSSYDSSNSGYDSGKGSSGSSYGSGKGNGSYNSSTTSEHSSSEYDYTTSKSDYTTSKYGYTTSKSEYTTSKSEYTTSKPEYTTTKSYGYESSTETSTVTKSLKSTAQTTFINATITNKLTSIETLSTASIPLISTTIAESTAVEISAAAEITTPAVVIPPASNETSGNATVTSASPAVFTGAADGMPPGRRFLGTKINGLHSKEIYGSSAGENAGENHISISETQPETASYTESKDHAPGARSETISSDEKKDFLSVDPKDTQPSSGATSVTGIDEIDQEKNQVETTEEVPPRDISGIRWILVVLAILSSTFLFALDNTIVADVQPVIVTAFHDVGKLTWLSVAFLIGAASTNLVWGKVYGQFEAKWTYILCVFLFEVGSAVCGSAPSMDALIVGRAICGVGGSGMYVGVMTLLAATTTMHERPMYIGGTGLTWGLGTVLGPIIGGAFTDSSAGWRYSFYINLFLGAVCAPVYIFLLPVKDPRPGVSFIERAREMDYVGALFIIGAFVSGVMAVSFGGITYPWDSGRIIGLFVCSGVLFILFGIQQTFTVLTSLSRRIFPVEFLKSRTMLLLFAMTSAGATAIFIPIYMIPIFFQFTRNDSALEAGVRLLPFIMLMIFAVISNGAILSAFGYYMPWYTAGGIFVVIGGALMFTVDTHTSIARVYGYSVLIGFGDGLFAQASFSVAQAIVPPDMAASAIGFITCAQVGGVTIALAIANSIFLNDSQKSISALLPNVPQAEIQQAIAGAGSDFVKNLSDEVREQVLNAIVTAMSKAYILVMVAGALAIVLSVLMKREKLFMAAGGAM
ncbi:hypothetical protein B7494_g5573 [Chlorociboria aeruginascens]|nr:hypothetical protein B7494_g5573 [Chlorociboria aeruginascens]